MTVQAANMHALYLLSSGQTSQRNAAETQPGCSNAALASVSPQIQATGASLHVRQPLSGMTTLGTLEEPPSAPPSQKLAGSSGQATAPQPLPSSTGAVPSSDTGMVSPFSEPQPTGPARHRGGSTSSDESAVTDEMAAMPRSDSVGGNAEAAAEFGDAILPPSQQALQPRLSKVEEVHSSMERSSTSDSDMALHSIMTDSQGRQGTSSVLSGIHEQERAQRISEESQRVSDASSVNSASSERRWRGRGMPSCPGIHPDFLDVRQAAEGDMSAVARHEREEEDSSKAGPSGCVRASDSAFGLASSQPRQAGSGGTGEMQQQRSQSGGIGASSSSSGGAGLEVEHLVTSDSAEPGRGTVGSGGALQRLWSSGRKALAWSRSMSGRKSQGEGAHDRQERPETGAGDGDGPGKSWQQSDAPPVQQSPRKGRRGSGWRPQGSMQAARQSLLGVAKGHRRSHTADNAVLE